MNCRDVARVLPELAAGEIDESRAAMARQHINICQSCASELAKYKMALSALDQQWETVETPDSLSFLHLPEKTTRRAVFHPALIAAVCTAAAALLIFMIRLDHTPKPTISKAPAQVDRVPSNQPVVSSEEGDVQQVEKPVNQTSYAIQSSSNEQYDKPKIRHPKPRSKPRSELKPVSLEPKQQEQPESIEEMPEEPEVPRPKPVIVIASRVVEPSIELESYNCVTGVYSQYYATYENSGEMTSEMESITNLD